MAPARCARTYKLPKGLRRQVSEAIEQISLRGLRGGTRPFLRSLNELCDGVDQYLRVERLGNVGRESCGGSSLSVLRRRKAGHSNGRRMTSHCGVHLANLGNQCITVKASHSDICHNDLWRIRFNSI